MINIDTFTIEFIQKSYMIMHNYIVQIIRVKKIELGRFR